MAKQKHTTTYSNDILLITRYFKQSQLKTNRSNARRFRTFRSREIIFRVIYSARSTTKHQRTRIVEDNTSSDDG